MIQDGRRWKEDSAKHVWDAFHCENPAPETPQPHLNNLKHFSGKVACKWAHQKNHENWYLNVFHLLLLLDSFAIQPRKGRKWPEALHLLTLASCTLRVDVVMYNAAPRLEMPGIRGCRSQLASRRDTCFFSW